MALTGIRGITDQVTKFTAWNMRSFSARLGELDLLIRDIDPDILFFYVKPNCQIMLSFVFQILIFTITIVTVMVVELPFLLNVGLSTAFWTWTDFWESNASWVSRAWALQSKPAKIPSMLSAYIALLTSHFHLRVASGRTFSILQ